MILDQVSEPVAAAEGADTLHVFEIDDSERHWYVARDEEDAFALFCDPGGAMNEDGATADEVSITRYDDGQLLRLWIEDENASGAATEKTCAAWIAEFGRGFMGSTVF